MNTAAYASLPAFFPEINLIENRNPTIEYAIIPIISIIRFHILSSKKLIPVIDKDVINDTKRTLYIPNEFLFIS